MKLTKNDAIIFFCALVATLSSYRFGVSDHIEQIPLIYAQSDANFLANDFFVSTSREFSPRLFYSKLTWLLGSLFSLPVAFLLLALFSNMLGAWMTNKVTRELGGSEKGGLIAAVCYLTFTFPRIGTLYTLYVSTLIPGYLVFPFILTAIYFVLKGKWIPAVLIACFTAFIHALLGLEMGGLILLLMFYSFIKKRVSVKLFVGMSLTYILVAAYLVYPLLTQEKVLTDTEFIDIIAHFRHPHHYLFSAVLSHKKDVLLALFMGLIILISGRKWWPEARQEHREIILLFLSSLIFLYLIGWVFVEIIPVRYVVIAQLFRLSNFIKWLAVVAIGLLFGSVSKNSTKKYQEEANILSLFNLTILSVYVALSSVFGNRKNFHAIAFFALILLNFWIARTFFNTQIHILLPIFLLIIIFSKLKSRVFYAIILTASLFFVGNAFVFKQLPVPKLIDRPLAQLRPYWGIPTTNQRRELFDFVRENTPEDALFLTPHDLGLMRIMAKRAIVVDYKSFPFSQSAMKEWYQRIQDCYGSSEEEFASYYAGLTDEALGELQQKYGFSHIIIPIDVDSSRDAIFQNDDYKVIKWN